jgi:hypothetical protein
MLNFMKNIFGDKPSPDSRFQTPEARTKDLLDRCERLAYSVRAFETSVLNFETRTALLSPDEQPKFKTYAKVLREKLDLRVKQLEAVRDSIGEYDRAIRSGSDAVAERNKVNQTFTTLQISLLDEDRDDLPMFPNE